MKIMYGRKGWGGQHFSGGSQWPETQVVDCWLVDMLMWSNYSSELKLKVNVYIH